jgi:methylated-DNA-[protein]-cysteine S-methyltransferase
MTLALHRTTHAGRFGPFTVLTRDDVVLAATWDPDPDTVLAVLTALGPAEVLDRRDLGPISTALRAYDDGDPDLVMTVAVEQPSGPFHATVREQLRRIAAGCSITYAELAARCGRPAAARAAGTACARNRIPLFVPCHRVVGSNGDLRGFAFGIDRKAALLTHEAVSIAGVTRTGTRRAS